MNCDRLRDASRAIRSIVNSKSLLDHENEMHGSTASIEITSSPRYKKLLGLVNTARSALLGNANLCQPYVKLIHREGLTQLRKSMPSIPSNQQISYISKNTFLQLY